MIEKQIFQGWRLPKQISRNRLGGFAPAETIAYIDDLAIGQDEEFNQLEVLFGEKYRSEIHPFVARVREETSRLVTKFTPLLENPPHWVIDLGDKTNDPLLMILQLMYYEGVFNTAKQVLSASPEIGDQELLRTPVKPLEIDGLNLGTSFSNLRRFELYVAGKTEDENDREMGRMTDEAKAAEIRRYSKYFHFGHYASDLPDEAKRNLASGLRQNAQSYMSLLEPLRQGGSNIVMIAGNWDERQPIDFKKGTADPLPKDERYFLPEDFWRDQGIPYYQQVAPLETVYTLQVLAPFDGLMGMGQMDGSAERVLRTAVRRVRLFKKPVIIAAHGEPNWRVHYLDRPDLSSFGEHPQTIMGFEKLILQIRPDKIVYEQMRQPFKDEKGQLVHPDARYYLRPRFSGEHKGVSLVTVPPFKNRDIETTYLSSGRVEMLEVYIDKGKTELVWRRVSG